LWKKLFSFGASEQLVQALISLYADACATVRGPDGYSELFNIPVGTREGGVESPLLYVLFVADLIAELNDVTLTASEMSLDGRPVRGLQLADDLALIATSEHDLNLLLERWAAFCDRTHQETQVRKTEGVVFTTESDAVLVLTDGRLTVELGGAEMWSIEFRYKGTPLRMVDAFVYLGVRLNWRLGAADALDFRDGKGWKILGGLKSALRVVPFLPFNRTVEIAEATVGGVYLYSSELWAPFLDRRTSGVSDGYAAWLLGLPHVTATRLQGWLPLRDLDIKAEASVVRVLQDAKTHGGLLDAAVRQLKHNWNVASTRRGELEPRSTWWGRVCTMLRRAWPRFAVRFGQNITLHGAPGLDDGGQLAHKDYATTTWRMRWHKRQATVLRKRPKVFQQEYLLYAILQKLGRLDGPLFPVMPTADTGAVRALVRTFAGVEDFARVNAHYKRRTDHPLLAANEIKRCCLACLAHNEHCPLVMDSEWHAFLECPHTAAARQRFIRSTGLTPRCSSPSTPEDLVALFCQVRCNRRFLDRLALFAFDIRSTRRHMFRQLKSDGPSGRTKVALRISTFTSYWAE